jgi:hypothetical protein
MLLLILTALPVQFPVHAQGAPGITVRSQYTLNRYGFATINESVEFTNNGSSAVQVPSLTFGFGNLSSKVVQYNLTGTGFSLSQPPSTGGPYTISGGQSIQAGGNASFVLSTLLNGVVSKEANGTLRVLLLSSPSISTAVDRLLNVVAMPASTLLKSAPTGMATSSTGSNNTYSVVKKDTAPQAATLIRAIAQSSVQDFHPLHVFSAERTITADSNGNPLVTDEIQFQNMGTTPLSALYISPLAPLTTKVTVLTVTEPRLLNPITFALSNGAIDMALFAIGYPNNGVAAGANFTLTYQYSLGAKYYSVSGGQVTMKVLESAPLKAFIDSYTISMSLPKGATANQATAVPLGSVTPWQGGATAFAYGLSVGWNIDAGVPAASLIFVLLLIGLFAARSTTAESQEEEEEEESSTELASAMIKAFDEKTNMINSLWGEIAAADPNELDKEYFDELRARLDSFRSRALARLNEVKQKSTSQKFFDVVNQMQTTEREVERAAKDKLNLYQQFYMRQMRKEVYDRLLPQYTKRLEKALNQLTDELHTVQREAKLL